MGTDYAPGREYVWSTAVTPVPSLQPEVRGGEFRKCLENGLGLCFPICKMGESEHPNPALRFRAPFSHFLSRSAWA